MDANRLAAALSAVTEHAQTQEIIRKALEKQIRFLEIRVEDAEINQVRDGKKIIHKLELRVRELQTELSGALRKQDDLERGLRQSERRVNELTFQCKEEHKNRKCLEDLIDEFQQRITLLKRQIDDAEQNAARNLAKFRKAQRELDEIKRTET